MAAAARAIAEDLVALINAADLSQAVEAIRAKRPNFELADTATLRVVVTPRGVEVNGANRAEDHHDHLTEVAIFKLVDNIENADLDPLDDLVEEIADTIRRAPLANAATHGGKYLRLAYESLTDEDEIQEDSLFFALISVIHRSTR